MNFSRCPYFMQSNYTSSMVFLSFSSSSELRLRCAYMPSIVKLNDMMIRPPIKLNNVLIENVKCYLYVWETTTASQLVICLKRQVYNSCVLPASTRELCLDTDKTNNLRGQTKMERSILHITYKDRKTNIWVREMTKVIVDIISNVGKIMWSWAGHISTDKGDQPSGGGATKQILERHDLAEDSGRQA